MTTGDVNWLEATNYLQAIENFEDAPAGKNLMEETPI